MGNTNAGKTGEKWKIVLVVGILALVLLAGAAGFFIWYNSTKDDDAEKFERYQFDTSAIEGRIQIMTEEEIQAELNRIVEDGMFNISIASAIVFESAEGEGEARIENIAANHYHMQVDLILDETQEVLYSSNLIRPGYSIEFITLDRKLEPGVYDATAVFSAITKEELQMFGQAAAKVKLYIPDENGVFLTPEPTAEPTPEP